MMFQKSVCAPIYDTNAPHSEKSSDQLERVPRVIIVDLTRFPVVWLENGSGKREKLGLEQRWLVSIKTWDHLPVTYCTCGCQFHKQRRRTARLRGIQLYLQRLKGKCALNLVL
ncbi:uncharacterized protein MCYG_06532 [Microsporum canis CBS 113480]|uniref:Uncharacterized protein n=1 Tax=Arthroderma otae (strain ATCC MYA-4605 / CBS 113480) TaxID=554155 RepID=C5FUX9_ARTOC|nr:uncharacterized protein MCYG_06532 [Microsporum canis CBS 113480]EEQ33713.1 predicted protein [Microsporum canis CBS 113480]